jgi:hypothetical protein
MSLAQHVSSTEGADREWLEPLIDEDFPLGWVLTYDPLPPLQVEDIADTLLLTRSPKPNEQVSTPLFIVQGQVRTFLSTEVPSSDCTFTVFRPRMFPQFIVHSKSDLFDRPQFFLLFFWFWEVELL